MGTEQLLQEPDWLPVGQEPQPAGNITHCSVMRFNGISVLSRHDGDIDTRTEPNTGMYLRDTRYLSRLQFSFGGVRPTLLDARQPDTALSAIFTNPAIQSPSGETIPAQSLVVRRRRVIADSLIESLNISNYGPAAVTLELRVEFDADFHDIFEVRGYKRGVPARPVRPAIERRCVAFHYHGADDIERVTRVVFSEDPVRTRGHEAVFRLELNPRDTHELNIEVSADRRPAGEGLQAANGRVLVSQHDWLNGVTHIETNDDAINDMLNRSLLDIHALQTEIGDDRYLAAGVPWFDTLFGRDSLIAGMELVAFAPEVLREALLVLAKYQATETDAAHDATPGKIAHELRWGELANAGEVPFGRYYGSIDSTPLFIIAAWEYVRWTEDYGMLRRLWPNIQAAMDWCRGEIAAGVKGFVAYARVSAAGLENQGWKDSQDSIVWPDGRLAEAPIALVEEQGYVGAALGAYAHMAAALGDPEAGDAAREAARFCACVDEAFGHEHLGYVLCLDGQGCPVPTPASNAGHLLWAGTARRDLAETTAHRLLAPDMFSGWGVRTLSSTVAGYNPLGYHTGSVWPHDNALFLAGLRWYGMDDHAMRLGSSLLEMALAFPEYRVPELFSGDARELRHVPTPYPVASRPQAWAAAAMPSVFVSMLGLRPGRPGQLMVTRPILPEAVKFVRVCNLRFAGKTIDLSFRKQGRNVSVEVERLPQGVEVVLSQAFPEEIPGQRGR